MLLRQIFDPHLAQYAYLVGCQRSGEALIIEPERDIDRYWELAAENELRITAVAEAAGLFAEREERIDFPDFRPTEALQQGGIIDVRTTAEFRRGHLDGALSFPYTRLKTRLGELPKHRRLFIHCGTGKRASLAASFPRSAGFDAVHIDGVCAECERIASAEGVVH
jgi:rhodanese-related sulfurtransferase